MSGLIDTLERDHGGKQVTATVWHFGCPGCGERATYRGTSETWKCPSCDRGGTSRDLARRLGATVRANGHHAAGDEREPDATDAAQPRAFTAVYRSMADVEPREIGHLWPGYFVLRKFNLVAGLGGVGKGQLMAHLIARWSRGDSMPYEALSSAPRQRTALRTLILAAEDDPHEDVRPRLDANVANLDNIFILDGVRAGDGDDLRWVDVEKHIPAVMDLVAREQIDIVYLDPLSSYMPGVQRQSAGSVRDTLGHLQRLINATGATVIGTLHLGKSMDRRGAHRILDSVEFVNAARNVLGVADLADAHQPEEVRDDAKRGRRRVIQVLKSNSSIPGKPLLWSRPFDAPVLWHDESPVSFDACFTVEAAETRLDDAMAFLHQELADAPKAKKEIESAARKKGLSDATLRRAKSELGIRADKAKGSKTSPWLWVLPSQGVHEEQDEHLVVDDAESQGVQDAHDEHLVKSDPAAREKRHFRQHAHREHVVNNGQLGLVGQDAQPARRQHLVSDEHLVDRADHEGEPGDDPWTA